MPGTPLQASSAFPPEAAVATTLLVENSGRVVGFDSSGSEGRRAGRECVDMFGWIERLTGGAPSAETAIDDCVVLLCETNGHAEGTFGKVLSKDPADPDIPWQVQLYDESPQQPTATQAKSEDSGEQAKVWLRAKVFCPSLSNPSSPDSDVNAAAQEFRRVENGETVEVEIRANIVKQVSKRKSIEPKWVPSEDKVPCSDPRFA